MIKTNCLIERLYDINSIKDLKFMYYNIKQKKMVGLKQSMRKYLWMVNAYTNQEKTKFEINSLLERLKYKMQ